MTEMIRIRCSNCLTDTNHTVLFQKESDEQLTEYDCTSCSLIECCGCSRVSMWVRHTLSGDWIVDETGSHFVVDETGSLKEEPDRHIDEFYPAPITRKKPTWVKDFELGKHGDKVVATGKILSEVYQAVANGQYALAAMGIRAALDQVMIATVGDLRTFDEKLDAFHKEGYISLFQRDHIGDTLEVGHAAMHRGHLPTEYALDIALQIVESVFAPIYPHKEKAEEIRADVPARRRK
jgi:Domain of unknown function (DUF4145)